MPSWLVSGVTVQAVTPQQPLPQISASPALLVVGHARSNVPGHLDLGWIDAEASTSSPSAANGVDGLAAANALRNQLEDHGRGASAMRNLAADRGHGLVAPAPARWPAVGSSRFWTAGVEVCDADGAVHCEDATTGGNPTCAAISSIRAMAKSTPNIKPHDGRAACHCAMDCSRTAAAAALGWPSTCARTVGRDCGCTALSLTPREEMACCRLAASICSRSFLLVGATPVPVASHDRGHLVSKVRLALGLQVQPLEACVQLEKDDPEVLAAAAGATLMEANESTREAMDRIRTKAN
nr:unnamed protein product [Digitaria exilis]